MDIPQLTSLVLRHSSHAVLQQKSSRHEQLRAVSERNTRPYASLLEVFLSVIDSLHCIYLTTDAMYFCNVLGIHLLICGSSAGTRLKSDAQSKNKSQDEILLLGIQCNLVYFTMTLLFPFNTVSHRVTPLLKLLRLHIAGLHSVMQNLIENY